MDIKEIRRANMVLLKGDGSLEALAEKVGTAATYLSQINTGGRAMGAALARQFEKKLRKPRGWMDAMHNNNARNSRALAPGPDVQARVPLISWLRAGEFEEASDVHHIADAEDWYPMPKKAGPNTFCLRVEGDSMTAPYGKSYPAGCVVFVDPDQRSPANGQRIIAKLEGSDEIVFKAFTREAGRVFLRALNPQYPPISSPFKIIGTVIGKWEDD